MAEVSARTTGLSVTLPSGAKVFGALSEDGEQTCFNLTAPDGVETRFSLSLDALATMVDIAMMLREAAQTKESGNADPS